MKIKKLIFNWYYTTHEGEDYCKYEVGVKGVKEIIEHKPMGEGDNWYCDVYFEDGSIDTVANINGITKVPDEATNE